MTVRWLSREETGTNQVDVIICTGERMEELVHRLYPGVRTTNFEPRHTQDRLSNDFRCYTNFEGSTWKWQ